MDKYSINMTRRLTDGKSEISEEDEIELESTKMRSIKSKSIKLVNKLNFESDSSDDEDAEKNQSKYKRCCSKLTSVQIFKYRSGINVTCSTEQDVEYRWNSGIGMIFFFAFVISILSYFIVNLKIVGEIS